MNVPIVLAVGSVTEYRETTTIPYLTFTFQFKLDKKGNLIDGEYGDFDIKY